VWRNDFVGSKINAVTPPIQHQGIPFYPKEITNYRN